MLLDLGSELAGDPPGERWKILEIVRLDDHVGFARVLVGILVTSIATKIPRNSKNASTPW
jgi:hypothetical protein